MRRVAHPHCESCGALHPEFESPRFGVRVCYRCLLGAATWLDSRGMMDHAHPLITELFDGVFGGGTVPLDSQFTVIVRSNLGSSVFAYKIVERWVDSKKIPAPPA